MIVAGYAYYGDAAAQAAIFKPTEITILGNGDRAHLDALARHAPVEIRDSVIEYFRPFVEGGRPQMRGAYVYGTVVRPGSRLSHLWWKEITEAL